MVLHQVALEKQKMGKYKTKKKELRKSMEKENIKEVKIFKDKEGKVKAYVRWGDEERTGTFPDFLLAMYWAEDFLYGENRDLEGECE